MNKKRFNMSKSTVPITNEILDLIKETQKNLKEFSAGQKELKKVVFLLFVLQETVLELSIKKILNQKFLVKTLLLTS